MLYFQPHTPCSDERPSTQTVLFAFVPFVLNHSAKEHRVDQFDSLYNFEANPESAAGGSGAGEDAGAS